MALTVLGIPLTKTWTFTTAPVAAEALAMADRDAAAKLPRLTIDRAPLPRRAPALHGARGQAARRAPGDRHDHGPRPQGNRSRSLHLAASRTLTVRARRATVTLRVAAFTASGTRYGPIRVSRSGAATPAR